MTGQSDPATRSDTARDEKPAEPFLTVVKGSPTDEEIAALVAVLSTAGGAGGTGTTGPIDDWGRPVDMHRVSWGMPSSYPHRG